MKSLLGLLHVFSTLRFVFCSIVKRKSWLTNKLVPRVFSASKMAGEQRSTGTRLPKYSKNRGVFCHVTGDEMPSLELISSNWQSIFLLQCRTLSSGTKTFDHVSRNKIPHDSWIILAASSGGFLRLTAILKAEKALGTTVDSQDNRLQLLYLYLN